MADKPNTKTSKKHTNKNIPNELLKFQRHKNNTSTLQNSKINVDKERKKNPVYRITVKTKKISPYSPVPTTKAPLRSNLQQRLTHDRKSIPPTKSNPMAKIFATTQFSFFSPNTVVLRRDHVEKNTYETHTAINLSSPLATDDPT